MSNHTSGARWLGHQRASILTQAEQERLDQIRAAERLAEERNFFTRFYEPRGAEERTVVAGDRVPLPEIAIA